MAPGLPQWGNEIALRAGRVMNTGDGIIGGMFMSGHVQRGLFRDRPAQGGGGGPRFHAAGEPVRESDSRTYCNGRSSIPDDWEKVWAMVNEKWDKREPCPEGALLPFNIDAKINGAYVALGLLYGKGDFGKTVEIATRGGQDSDCNPASAGGILGVMLGYRRIPDAVEERHPGHRRQEIQLHGFHLSGDCGEHGEARAGADRSDGRQGGRGRGGDRGAKTEAAACTVVGRLRSSGGACEDERCAVGMEGRVEDLGGGGPSGANRVRRGQRSRDFVRGHGRDCHRDVSAEGRHGHRLSGRQSAIVRSM